MALSLGCVLAAPCANADQIAPATLLDLTTTVYSNTNKTYSFDAPGPGTVWVDLVDLSWPEKFQSLSSTVYNAAGTPLRQVGTAAEFNVPVTQAGTLYALVAGVTGTLTGLDVGMYSLDVGFTPAGTPVPLPEGFRLLLVGLGLVATVRLLWKRPASGWSVVPQQASAMKA